MLIGMKGAGVSTQIKMLCEKFKIDAIDLMPEYLKT
jgi:adenylate/nucleoside-diphosphate kinase